MLQAHKTYRSYLKDILAERTAKNPAYSLRAMARQLDLQPSHLSGIIKGSKSLSVNRALELAHKLGLLGVDAEHFCLLVEYDQAKTPERKDTLLQRMRAINSRLDVKDLSVDLFKTICVWYHLPILEMTELTDFDYRPAEIAARLGISVIEVEAAIERLERLELIEKDEQGRYRKAHDNLVFKSEIPNAALRQFHKQMLEKASHALETQKPDERYVGSDTYSIDPSQLDEARKVIEECRAKLYELFNQGEKKTETYHLGVQLFSLTHSNKQGSKEEE